MNVVYNSTQYAIVAYPARQAFVSDLVARENASNAVALNAASFNSARMIGPAVAGIVIVAVGIGVLHGDGGVSVGIETGGCGRDDRRRVLRFHHHRAGDRFGLGAELVDRRERHEHFFGLGQFVGVGRVRSPAVDGVLDLGDRPNGGGVALGHPLGCTGAMLTCKLLSELKRTGKKYGVVSMCIGGGMGAAGVYEMC